MAGYKVYMHTFPNGKRYVGITCQNLERRWRGGKGYEGQVVYDAILKYGWDNMRHEKLFDNLTKEQAEAKEVELIAAFKTMSHKCGYNVDLGGNSCGKLSESTRKKISAIKKGQMAGEKHWHFGGHWGAEVRKKISAAHRGMTYGEDTLAKKRKLFSGKNNPMYGTKMSAEHKKKLQAACVKATAKPVVCIETGIIYASAAEAARKTGVNARSIGHVCNKHPKYKKAGGYHWTYAERSS